MADTDLSRRGFVKLLGAALTVPTLGTLGLQRDSPIVVAHSLEQLNAGVEPLQFEPLDYRTDLLHLRQYWNPQFPAVAVRIDGVTIGAASHTRWIAAEGAELHMTEDHPISIELRIVGGVLTTTVRRA